MARIQLERLPETDDELYELVKVLWGVVIPRHKVCPEHVAPFQAFADAYFNRDGSISLWHGSRGLSGKSFMLSILGITKAFMLGADVNLLGGSLAQSTNIHEHMRAAFDSPNAPKFMIETEANYLIKLNNRAKIRPLTASQKTVRGPHPPFLILDEIDEMDLDILDAALGQPMPQRNYLGTILEPYTVMCLAEGTQVLTSGGEKPIETVDSGDLVLTRDGWQPVYERIDNGYRETVEVKLSNGRTLVCTPDHRVAVGNGWVEAGNLVSGDVLATVEPSQFSSTSLFDLSASAALPSSMSRDEGVTGTVGVPFGAVSLQGVVLRGSVASTPVLSSGDRLQMTRVDAGWVLAEMIDLHPFWNGADETHIRPPMGVTCGDEFTVDDSVTEGEFTAAPYPAAANVFASGDKPVTVVGVNDGLTRHVYDLSVMGTPEFVAESIVVHNCSTWQNSDGTFTEIKRRFEERNLPVKTWCYKDTANPIDGWLTQSTIDAKKLEIPAEMWRVEYELGEPSIGNRAFDSQSVEDTFSLPMDNVEATNKDNLEEYIFEQPTREGVYVVAADWAKEQDKTVISVIRLDKHPHELVYYMRVNRRPYPLMIGWFNKAIDKYHAEAIHDATGLGNVVNDYIDVRARKFIMTGEKRANMLTEFVGAVERGYFQFPRIPSAYTEMKYCRTGDLYSSAQKDYHLPDTVCSLALAWNVGKRYSGYGDPITVKGLKDAPGRIEHMFEFPKESPDDVTQSSFEVVDMTAKEAGEISFLV